MMVDDCAKQQIDEYRQNYEDCKAFVKPTDQQTSVFDRAFKTVYHEQPARNIEEYQQQCQEEEYFSQFDRNEYQPRFMKLKKRIMKKQILEFHRQKHPVNSLADVAV